MIIFISGRKEFFIETGDVLKSSFEQLGFTDVQLIFCGDEKTFDCKNKDIFVVIGRRRKLKFINAKKKYVYFVEQVDRMDDYRIILNRFDHIFFMFNEAFDKWESDNKSLLPFGYHNLLDTDVLNPSKINDFFFFGALTKLRKGVLDKQVLFKQYCYGEERDKFILNSKINIILGARKNYHLPHIHFSLILSKGGFVALKNISVFTPFEEGKHFISFNSYKDLQPYIDNDKLRNDFSKKAYNDFCQNFNMVGILKRTINYGTFI